MHEHDHDARAPVYGLDAAQRLGPDPARVLETLIVALDGQAVALTPPFKAELDLKALAAAACTKRAALADSMEAARATGYVVGGIGPLGQRRRLPTYVDSSTPADGHVYVSAGRRGLKLELALGDLLRVTGARLAAIAR